MRPEVAYCHVIAGLLAADGIMEETEKNFLGEIFERLALTREERDDVVHFEGADNAEAVVKTMPIEQRQALRDDLLAATLADGRISPLESKMMQRLSELMGL